MASGNLDFKITLDGVTQTNTSLTRISARFAGLSAAARTAGGSIALVGTGLAKLGTGTAALALTALSKSIKGITVASTAMGIASTVAFKHALSYGAQMHKTASLLGVDAGQVDLLSQAFKENGAGAEMVAQSMAFMMRSISNGSKGFEKLGLSVKELKGMTVVEQFEAIGNAIRGMTSQEDKVAAMMEIFGRSGSQLAQLMNNPNALGDAARTLGSEARILAEQAATFERVNTLIGNIGTKVRTMFTGIAAGLVSPLRGVLETLNSFDVASWGERIGQAIGRPLQGAIEAFKQARLGEYLGDAFSLALHMLQDKLTAVFLDSGIAPAFGKLLGYEIGKAIRSAVGGEYWDKARNFLGRNFAGVMASATGAGTFEEGANAYDKWEQSEQATEEKKLFDQLGKAFSNVGDAVVRDTKSVQTALEQTDFSKKWLQNLPDNTVQGVSSNAGTQLPDFSNVSDQIAKGVSDGVAHSQYFHVGGYGANESPVRSPEYTFTKNTADNTKQTVSLLTQGNAWLRQLATSTASTSCTYA